MHMRRYYGSWSYLAFTEGQANRQGMPHFHVLSDRLPSAPRNAQGHVTKHNIHDWAHKLGFGYEADVQTISSSKAAAYVSKYASKGDPAIPKGFRRVRASQNWTKSKPDPDHRLLVPARKEDIAHFIVRVSDETGVTPEDLVCDWQNSWERVYNEQ